MAGRTKIVALQNKRQVRHSSKREPRSIIISFRLRESEADLLRADLDANPSAGVKSLKQFARKLAVDYARGRMTFIDPLDRRIDACSRDALDRQPPFCILRDVRFIADLDRYLVTGERWRSLRFFMLGAGWPVDITERFNAAIDDDGRLCVVHEFLQKMLENDNLSTHQE
jgi:hypothetical protein